MPTLTLEGKKPPKDNPKHQFSIHTNKGPRGAPIEWNDAIESKGTENYSHEQTLKN
jgi:hypothetical protein